MITEKDDLRHVPGPEENFSESKWFSFYDEINDIWVSSRMGLEPNKKKANRWLVAALGGKIVINDLAVGIELPNGNWDGIEAGGLEYRTIEPMTRYGIKFDLGSVSADVQWHAVTPVFDYKDCIAPLPPSLAAEHYEQSGQISGSMKISDQTFTIEGTAHRDHSWGVRHWEGFRSWIAFMGHFGKDFFFHMEQFHEQSTGWTRHGFIYRDGENVPIKDADMTPGYSGGIIFPPEFDLQLEDARGQIFDIKGKYRAGSPLAFGNCTVMESFGTFSMGDAGTAGIIEYGFTHNP